MRYWLFFISIILLPKFSEAQLAFGMNVNYRTSNSLFSKDSTKADTLPRKKMSASKKATIMSACLPGLGQIYNKKWWKTPIIYAGFGGLVYGFSFNNKYYTEYRNSLRYRYDNNAATIDSLSRYTDNDLVTLKNYYQKHRDLCVIGMAALYTLQVLDAAVDAHLATFDVSDNLSMQISPSIYQEKSGVVGMIGLRFYYR
ncbi:MAG: DUF5683 domain-containing protein [Bacteroidetes bacterium]|jgi:hypothetical protein|nr:DUF5683 domain-containing protein [Bacteroidota bacterium]